MDKQVIFVRDFTSFAQLQREQKYIYSILHSEGDAMYGVEVACENTAGDSVSQVATRITSQRQHAEIIAKFLYDNAVCPEHLPDIIHDFKVQGVLH